MKRVELGVFLPIARNGFVCSGNAPAYTPSYRENLEITLAAERIGLDFVFSMSKWRGFGGTTGFWDSSLESFSLMAALAGATQRIKLVATVNPLLFHPALMAKMVATIDGVSEGRLALNIITGATMGEYEQMGVVPANYARNRYTYAGEWIQLLKRLWSEPSVTHCGEYFRLDDCVSDPKPVQRPHPPLVCAATSEEGLAFTAREVDCSFVSGRSIADVAQKSRRAKALAAEQGRRITTAAPVLLVMGDDQAAAEAYQELLLAGADTEAALNMGMALVGENREKSKEHGAERIRNNRQIYFGMPVVGGPQEIAAALLQLVEEGDIDSLLLLLPDYLQDMARFETHVLPILQNHLDVGVRHESRALA